MNFSIINLKITLQESRFKGKITLGKEVFMNEFEVYYFQSGSERVPLDFLPIP